MDTLLPCVQKPFPGPTARKIIEQDEKYLATTTKHLPVVIKRGDGAIIEDVDSNLFLDFTSGVCVTNIGQAHPNVTAAIREQCGKFAYFAGTDFYYDVQTELAEKLCQLVPGNFPKKVFYTNSGAESVEAAIKIAKKARKAGQFIGFIGAFHGRTMGANSFIGCKAVQRKDYFPMMPGVLQIPYAYCYRCAYHEKYPGCDVWCAKILEEVYFKQIMSPEDIAGILVEPIQGEGGYIVPPDEFIQELSRISKKYGIILIMDEIQTGIGRTGKFFAVEHTGVVPDVTTVAKSLASGLPMGAAIMNARYDFPVKGCHSNTFGGNPVCSAAALATIETIEVEKLVIRAHKEGAYLKSRLGIWQKKWDFVGDVRGRGLFAACEFVIDRVSKKHAVKLVDDLVDFCFQKGLILMQCGTSSIRFAPPLNIKRAQLDFGLDIVEAGLRNTERNFKKYANGNGKKQNNQRVA